MDKQLREQIKHDKFVEEVGHTVEYLKDHREMVKKYGGAAAAVLVLIIAVFAFMSYQKSSRQEAFRKAALNLDGFVGDAAQNPVAGVPTFKTQAEKDGAAIKAFSEIANKYSGTTEGDMARYYTGYLQCDQGKTSECEAALTQAGQSGDKNVSSLAKLALVNLYMGLNKTDQAEKVARELSNSPTAVVSKEQAQITLARAIMKSKPQESKLICESLQALDRPAVTRACVAVLGEMIGTPGMPR